MKKLFKVSSLIGVLLFALTGCGTTKILNIPSTPIVTDGQVSSDAVYKAIKMAGVTKGWTVTKISDGVAHAILNIRKHQSVVEIRYNTNSYSIKYLSSRNLKSDGVNIHSNYNGWVRNLKQAIDVQLSGITTENSSVAKEQPTPTTTQTNQSWR